jgi:short-subunit dehydrogenase involved in D-alanine esterification of teichoic acids
MHDTQAGSTVLITAGGAGIGRAMAEAFAATGARVWITDILQSALDGCPPEWLSDCVDVADPVAMSELIQRV